LLCLSKEDNNGFDLTEEQTMLQAMVRDFVSKEIEPYAAEWDETGKFPSRQSNG